MKFLKSISIVLASLFAALALSGCANNNRLEAFVSSEDPSKLHINIGGAALADQVYAPFLSEHRRGSTEAQRDRNELRASFDVASMAVYAATADEFASRDVDRYGSLVGFRRLEGVDFDVSKSSRSSVSNGKVSFELRGTLTREDGSSWDLAPGDAIAVYVEVSRRLSPLAGDYVIVVVSEPSES